MKNRQQGVGKNSHPEKTMPLSDRTVKRVFYSLAAGFLSAAFLVPEDVAAMGALRFVLTKAHAVTAADLRAFFAAAGIVSALSGMLYKSQDIKGAEAGRAHIFEIDGIKVIGALGIVMFHWQPYGNFWPSGDIWKNLRLGPGLLEGLNGAANYALQFGHLSVGMFIILSGAGLALSHYSLGRAAEQGYWRRFYAKRLVRLLPLYWLAVLASFGYAYYLSRPVSLKGMAASMLLMQNYYGPWLAELALVNSPLWFVPVILALYLLFPVLVKLRDGLGELWFAIFSVVLSLFFFNTFVWLFPLSRIGEFGLGIVLGARLARDPEGTRRALGGFPLGVFSALLFAGLVYTTVKGLRYALVQPLLPVFALLTCWSVVRPLVAIGALRRALVGLSLASYGVYLFHPLLARLLNPGPYRGNFCYGLMFAITVFFLSYLIAKLELLLRAALSDRLMPS